MTAAELAALIADFLADRPHVTSAAAIDGASVGVEIGDTRFFITITED